jgi:hypothetical protein
VTTEEQRQEGLVCYKGFHKLMKMTQLSPEDHATVVRLSKMEVGLTPLSYFSSPYLARSHAHFLPLLRRSLIA